METMVEGDIEGEGSGQARRKLARLFKVSRQGGEDPRPPFGGGIEGNGKECMIDVWIPEAPNDGVGEILTLFLT